MIYSFFVPVSLYDLVNCKPKGIQIQLQFEDRKDTLEIQVPLTRIETPPLLEMKYNPQMQLVFLPKFQATPSDHGFVCGLDRQHPLVKLAECLRGESITVYDLVWFANCRISSVEHPRLGLLQCTWIERGTESYLLQRIPHFGLNENSNLWIIVPSGSLSVNFSIA